MSYPTDADLFGDDEVQRVDPVKPEQGSAFEQLAERYPTTPVRTRSARNLQQDPPPPVTPVLSLARDGAPGFIDAGQVTLLFSDPKAGKSWAALEIARRVASGSPFLGVTPTTTGPVLYLDFEMSHAVWYDRLRRLELAEPSSPDGWPEDLHIACRMDDAALDLYQGWDRVVALVREIDPVLIIIDTLRAATAEDENAADAGKFLGMAKLLAYATDATPAVLVLHHTVKSEATTGVRRMAGSGALWARADTVAELATKDGVVTLIPHGGRFEVPPPVTYRIDTGEDGGRRFVRAAGEVTIPESRRDEQRAWEILGDLEDAGTPATASAVAASIRDGATPTDTQRRATQRVLDRLVEQKRAVANKARLPAGDGGRTLVQTVYHPLGRGARMSGAWSRPVSE